ncbi:MAG: hypothetical protein J6S67_24025 [Methanobrevibacter sp.]|nr:hypothetical protein [Methanobrevibacter sp.]
MDNFGNWIDDGFKIGIKDDNLPVYKCKFCKKRVFVLIIDKSEKANYCPVCGKDMFEGFERANNEKNI